MEKVNEKKQKRKRDPHVIKVRNYILLTTVATIAALIALAPYAQLIDRAHDAQITIAFTLLFIVCIFIGRYLSGIWISGQRKINTMLYVVLGTAVVASLLVLFIHAQVLYNTDGRGLPLNFFTSGASLTVLGTCLGLLIKITRFSINSQLKEAKASAAQSLSELQFLQSQLSPHFLFNTLNNLYGISLSQQEKIPSLLLKLSDLLRYSVYDAKELYVPLSDEINYIKNYIDFERLRIGDRLELDTTIEEVLGSSVKIPPLLLIVFIENAFKHAKNTLTDKIQVSIVLKTFGKDILFSVRNSFDANAEPDKMEGRKGLGLENVSKRLELLYPGKYELITTKEDNIYSVKLQIKQG
ncbi:MAG: histidine kinase [Chitinophagaceae bacterium]|nr:histidine kinase [Chitinophagaceae bacterium]MCW5928335.1 histidine kinase [Chitinophagaceae bacterium]